MTASKDSVSAPSPVPLAIARSMLSFGIEASLAFCTASPSDGFPSTSPPPSRAATVMARASFVKCWPRRASTIAFLCLIDAHLEWPDMLARRLPGPLCSEHAPLARPPSPRLRPRRRRVRQQLVLLGQGLVLVVFVLRLFLLVRLGRQERQRGHDEGHRLQAQGPVGQ